MSGNLGRVLWYVFATSRGGPTRIRIMEVLLGRPFNMHQLSKKLGMDYKTIQHHIKVLDENNIIVAEEKKYGSIYFPSPMFEEAKGVFKDIRKEMK